MCGLKHRILLQPSLPGQKAEGQLLLKLTYKPFEDDESDAAYKEAEAYAQMLQEQAITDIKSAAGQAPLACWLTYSCKSCLFFRKDAAKVYISLPLLQLFI